MKKFFPTIIFVLIAVAFVGRAFAEDTHPMPVRDTVLHKPMLSGFPSGTMSGIPNHPEMMQGKHMNLSGTPQMTNLQDRAKRELTRRLDSLQGLLTKINGLKHLTSDQKTSLTTQVQNEISTLTNLETKIQGDTDPATLKIDVQSIIQEYRVFALFMPQIQILIGADRLGDITDNLSVLIAKLQTRISQVPTGTNVTTIQNVLTDMQTKLADAKTQAQNATNLVIVLTPAGYPANKTSLQNARVLLQTGRQDIAGMVEDMKNIRTDIKQWETSITTQPTALTPTMSITVTESVSSSPTP